MIPSGEGVMIYV